jgi:hypothetical protein
VKIDSIARSFINKYTINFTKYELFFKNTLSLDNTFYIKLLAYIQFYGKL